MCPVSNVREASPAAYGEAERRNQHAARPSSSGVRQRPHLEPRLTLPNRTIEPLIVGFGKPVSKSRLPLKTEQIQKPNQKANAISLKRFTDR
jgi:hypothetical protein